MRHVWEPHILKMGSSGELYVTMKQILFLNSLQLVHGHVHHELATINEEDSAIVTAEESGVSTGYIPSLLNMRKGERIHRCKHCNFRDGLKSFEDHLRET